MPNKKISELTAAGALTGAELVEAVQNGQNVKTTTQDIADLGGGGPGSADWGDIGGTLADQTDLQTALDQKTTDLNAHINDATDAHDASAISFTPTGKIGSANVQAAIAELDTEVDERILDALAGLKWKDAVRVATTGPGTLATDFENGDTVDGVVIATGDRILLKDQADQTENGIRIVAASGAPARSTDADSASELEGAAVSVLEGSTNANTTWLQITDSITLGSSNIVFTQYGSSVPDADGTTKGIGKLYASTGTGTDGSITRTVITSELALKAPLASPTFTGTPTLPTGSIGVTQSAGNNSTALATTAYVQTELSIFSLPGPVIISSGTLNIADSHHNKTLIFTVNCTVTIPSGLRADLIFDVYAISTVTAVVFTTGITYEASPVGATVIRGGMTGSFRMRTTNSIIAIFGENLQEQLVTPSTDVVTTVNTAADINGLSVTLQESSVYAIKGQLVIGCDNTGGVKVAFVSPSGAFYRIVIFGLTTAATAYTRVILAADGLTSVGFCTVNSAGAGGFVTVEGTIDLGAGEGGTFKMQFASTTGGQTSTVYRFGSYLRFTKIV